MLQHTDRFCIYKGSKMAHLHLKDFCLIHLATTRLAFRKDLCTDKEGFR